MLQGLKSFVFSKNSVQMKFSFFFFLSYLLNP